MMTTHHRETGHTDKDRDFNFHIEDPIDIGPGNDNESSNSSDTMLAFGGLEANGCLGNLLPSNQVRNKQLVDNEWRPEKVSK